MRGLLLIMLTALSLQAGAEQAVRNGPYTVHYAAIRTTDLTPEVARQFGVRRSAKQALLVLNVQRDEGAPLPAPVPATATGTVTSLLGHRQTLSLRPMQEGGVHYVIGRFETLTAEYLTLEISVLPDGAAKPIPLKFQQQFFNE